MVEKTWRKGNPLMAQWHVNGKNHYGEAHGTALREENRSCRTMSDSISGKSRF